MDVPVDISFMIGQFCEWAGGEGGEGGEGGGGGAYIFIKIHHII